MAKHLAPQQKHHLLLWYLGQRHASTCGHLHRHNFDMLDRACSNLVY